MIILSLSSSKKICFRTQRVIKDLQRLVLRSHPQRWCSDHACASANEYKDDRHIERMNGHGGVSIVVMKIEVAGDGGDENKTQQRWL